MNSVLPAQGPAPRSHKTAALAGVLTVLIALILADILLYMLGVAAAPAALLSAAGSLGLQWAAKQMDAARFPAIIVAFCMVLFIARVLSMNPAKSGDMNFTMDDGYIYSNYVVNAAHGHMFEYNIGEKSGGITGLLWFFAQIPVFKLISLAVSDLRALHYTAYALSFVCMACAALVMYQFARRLYSSVWVAAVVTLLVAADPQLLWGAVSGLELPLSTLYVLLMFWAAWESVEEMTGDQATADARQRRRFFRVLLVSLSLLAFWVRPLFEMMTLGVAMALALEARRRTDQERSALRALSRSVAVTTCIGVVLGCALYLGETGRIFPASYYAKVGTINLWAGIWSNMTGMLQLLTPLETLLYGVGALVFVLRWARGDAIRDWLLPAVPLALFLCAKNAALAYPGQMHRYISPLSPILYLYGLGAALAWMRSTIQSSLRSPLDPALTTLVLRLGFAICLLGCYHTVETQIGPVCGAWVTVRNDSGKALGEWIRDHTPETAIIAAEPIGALHTYCGRATIDIVGLTTPVFAGHYPDWNFTFAELKRRHADYLVFYPAWFKSSLGELPPFIKPYVTGSISGDVPAESIGSNPIVIYKFDWSQSP